MIPPMQLYACWDCGREKRLPERPSDAPLFVRVGCENCCRIKRHYAVGKAAYPVGRRPGVAWR